MSIQNIQNTITDNPSNFEDIYQIFYYILNHENSTSNNTTDIITKLHEHIHSISDIKTLLILCNVQSSYIKTHIISEVINNWCINTNPVFQVYFIKMLFDQIDFESLNINFDIILVTLQKLLKNIMIQDKVIIQSLQEVEHKNLCIIYFTLNERKISLNTTGIFSECTLLEIVAKEMKETDHVSTQILKLFNYLLQHTDLHVNVYNMYAVLADLYEHIPLKFNHHFFTCVNNFFIKNNQDLNSWIKSKKFYDKLYKHPFTNSDQLKQIIINIIETDDINDISSFLLLSDQLNQNVLSYCYTLLTLENIMMCDWIPTVLKHDYKHGCYYKINNCHYEKINSAFYMNGDLQNLQNLQNCLKKLNYTHFFLINIPNKYSDQSIVKEFSNKTYNTFIKIASKKFPTELCKIIYKKVLNDFPNSNN